MNNVYQIPPEGDNKHPTTIATLLRNHPRETAFIGTCGNGRRNVLYLIVWRVIIDPTEPRRLLWDSGSCPVEVREFVNVTIYPKRKADEQPEGSLEEEF